MPRIIANRGNTGVDYLNDLEIKECITADIIKKYKVSDVWHPDADSDLNDNYCRIVFEWEYPQTPHPKPFKRAIRYLDLWVGEGFITVQAQNRKLNTLPYGDPSSIDMIYVMIESECGESPRI